MGPSSDDHTKWLLPPRYLQATAAHGVHDGGVVDDPVRYPSIHCSQHQVTVGGCPAARQQPAVERDRKGGVACQPGREQRSPEGVADHQEGHVHDISVLQDLIGSLLHQLPVRQDHLLPIELLLGLALAPLASAQRESSTMGSS